MYAWIADSPHAVRHCGKFQRPQPSIMPLVSAGVDPTKTFTKMPKKETRIAISIINKQVDEILEDLQISED